MIKKISKLKNGEFISAEGTTGFVFRFTKNEIKEKYKIKVKKALVIEEEIKAINYPWDIFRLNDWAIRQDFELLTQKKKSQSISKTNKTIRSSDIFIEKGAKVEHCILNASTGPIYIGKNAEVMEGCIDPGAICYVRRRLFKNGNKSLCCYHNWAVLSCRR